jgi:6-phosphogluconolactonase
MRNIKMKLHIYKDPAALSFALAEWITDTIETTLTTSDRFTWVLTGGGSPKQLYELLAKPPFRNRIDWKRLHIFWGDERFVPFTDSRNNAKMTFDHLLNHVPVIPGQVHKMNTDKDPAQSAAEYEKILRGYSREGGLSFDLVLTGMGDDGHTLSLFPHTPVIHEKNAWVKAFYLDAQEMFRITLTAPIVNRAKKICFLTFGEVKAKALAAVLEGGQDIDQYPSQVIQPVDGELHVFTDEAAAKDLKNR